MTEHVNNFQSNSSYLDQTQREIYVETGVFAYLLQ